MSTIDPVTEPVTEPVVEIDPIAVEEAYDPNSRPESLDELKEHILCSLGCPVVEINVTEGQMNCAIANAMDFWREYHFDGIERFYLAHQLTEEDYANECIKLNDHNITAISRVFKFHGFETHMYGDRLNSLEQAVMAREVYNLINKSSLVDYYVTRQYIALLDDMFHTDIRHRFKRHTETLYLDFDWDRELGGIKFVMLEGHKVIDPEQYNKVYSNWVLRDLATAYVKRQWGQNLLKFSGLQMPGGVEFNGRQIYDDAVAEIDKIKEQFILRFQEPDDFFCG